MKFDRYIVFTPTNFVAVAHQDGQVVLELDVSDKQLGLAPGLGLMLSMSIADTRKLALALNKRADDAEAEQSRQT